MVMAKALILLAAVFQIAPAYGESLLIDDFQGSPVVNRLGNRANVFLRAPSKAMVSRREEVINGTRMQVLLLRYEKLNQGGPFNSGGWCGYYTLLKSPKNDGFDARGYEAVTFWVRGEGGHENFAVGLADRHWNRIGDSVKSQGIGAYLPAGKMTTQWQKATIALSEFYVDLSQLFSVAIVFEGDLYPGGGQRGTVYLSDIAFE